MRVLKLSILFLLMSLLVFPFILANHCMAQDPPSVPKLIEYIGTLEKANGSPYPQGIYYINFEIFLDEACTVPSGWFESHNVEISGKNKKDIDGATSYEATFSVILGSINLLDLIFDQDLYLRVTESTLGHENIEQFISTTSALTAETSVYVYDRDNGEYSEVQDVIINKAKDADTVDTFHASDTPTANTLLTLNASGQFSDSVIPDNITIDFAAEAGNAHTVDEIHASDLEESSEIDADISIHASITDAHHKKTTSFAELTDGDMATDEQIPDDITVNHAATANYASIAGDADTVDGKHASEFLNIDIVNAELFPNLNEAISHIGSSPGTLFINKSIKAVTNQGSATSVVTVPENVTLWFARGGSIVPDTGVEVLVRGAILAPGDQMIFDTRFGTFNIKWLGELIANWWSGSDIGEQVNNMLASLDLERPSPLEQTTLRVKIIGNSILTTPINMTNIRPTNGLVVTMEGRLLCKVGTNRPAIDMVGSRGIIAINWFLYGDLETISGIGILCARTPSLKGAGNHKFLNLVIGGEWAISPIYLIDSECNYFQNVDIRTQRGKYGFFFAGRNIDEVESPYQTIDDTSSQTGLHIDGLYMRTLDITKGGFYVSGADRVHLSGQTYIFTNTLPKIVLDMTISGIKGFWCDGLHGEGNSTDAIRIIGPGKRLGDVFIRCLGLSAQENAIHIDARLPDGSPCPAAIFIRNARFDFGDTAPFRCSGQVRMEQAVEIRTRGDSLAPDIILGEDFNGEIWGGDISKLTEASRIMAGLYHDGVHNTVHEFRYRPVLTFPDGDIRPNVSGGTFFRTANSAPTTIVNFLNGQLGQEITILVDSNTTIRNSVNIRLLSDTDFVGSDNDMITLVKMGVEFIEKSRSVN